MVTVCYQCEAAAIMSSAESMFMNE